MLPVLHGLATSQNFMGSQVHYKETNTWGKYKKDAQSPDMFFICIHYYDYDFISTICPHNHCKSWEDTFYTHLIQDTNL